jgi:hypothetical protein
MLTKGITLITAIKRCITTAMIGMPINVVEPMSPIVVTTKKLIRGQTMISTITFYHEIYVTTSTSASTTEYP